MLFGDLLAIWWVRALLGTMSVRPWYLALCRGLLLWRAWRAIAFDAARLAATPDRAVGALHLRGAHPVAARVAEADDRELSRLRALPTASSQSRTTGPEA